MSKIKFRVKNKLTKKERKAIKNTFKDFVNYVGGAAAMCRSTKIPIGTIKGILGDKNRLPSPILVNKLSRFYCINFNYNIRKKLRPDVTKSQWDRLDSLVMEAEKC